MTQVTATPKHDLTEFIPMEKDLNYLPRSVDADLVEISKMPLAKRRPVYLLSEAATGKTSTVRNFAFEKKLPFLLIEVDASMNFNDLLYKVKLQNATATYEPGLLIKMIQQPSVILFDELEFDHFRQGTGQSVSDARGMLHFRSLQLPEFALHRKQQAQFGPHFEVHGQSDAGLQPSGT